MWRRVLEGARRARPDPGVPGLPRLRICVSELHPDGGSTASLPALNNTPVARLHLSARDVSATACRRSILLLIYTSLPHCPRPSHIIPPQIGVAHFFVAAVACCLLLLLLGRGRFERWLSFPLPSTSTSPPHIRTNFIVRIPAPGPINCTGVGWHSGRSAAGRRQRSPVPLTFLSPYRPFISNHLLPHPRHVEPRRQAGRSREVCVWSAIDHSAPSSTAAFILACLSTIVRLAGFR